MSKKKRLLALAAILLCITTIVLWNTRTKYSSLNTSHLVLYGNVDIREVDLGFRVSGKVKDVFFDEGDTVKAGDLLATLDPKPYNEKLWKAKADVQSVQIAMKNAKKQFQRRQKAKNSLAISEEDYENALVTYEGLKSQVESSLANFAVAKTELEDTNLYSPSNGVILTRIREPGSILKTGDPIFTLNLNQPIWIRCYIDEPNLGLIFPGMKAKITTDTKTNSVYDGHIGFISSVAEFTPKNVESPQLRTDLVFRLRIIIENPDNGLRQGMPVTVELIRG
ncbi:MAG: efflux RND transporter periplasmic adaptor subunit [Chlamydiae bacterium]|nr:efflux RND transporter periplasmic adaptor subunit [Chlamydiota bacterium]